MTAARRHRATLLALLLLALSAMSLVACGNPAISSDTLNHECTGTADTVTAAISGRLDKGAGALRNVKQVTQKGVTFVSAELHAPGDAKHDKGDILTWATTNPKSESNFQSVDVHAKEKSKWPHASFDVRKKGAYESRACTDITRGKTKAQLECEQQGNNNASGGPTFNNNQHCENL